MASWRTASSGGSGKHTVFLFVELLGVRRDTLNVRRHPDSDKRWHVIILGLLNVLLVPGPTTEDCTMFATEM